jgi:hypothetical protein
VQRVSGHFFDFSSPMVSVLQVWMHASPQGPIGVFRLYHNICNLGMSNASLHRAIAPRQLVAEITPFFYYLRAWDFGRAILPAFVWPISTGSKLDVSGKGRRQTRLPLTQEIGDAIATYLLQGRPPCVSGKLFIRARPPFLEFRSPCAMTMIVRRAMRRAKVKCASRGAAHVLRHSAATAMLRQGASLQEIAVILRHRSIQTTEVYAKVDVAALNLIAQPWPEVSHAS